MDSFKNYYSILNVPETASHEEIKAAFRRMARLYSPDVNPDPSVVRLFESVLEAWGVLSNPLLRREYDQSRGVWNFAEGGISSFTRGMLEKDSTKPSSSVPTSPPPSPPSPPPADSLKGKDTFRRQASRARERDEDMEDYFERSSVPVTVLGSLLLLGLSGWLRLASLTDGRGGLKALLLGAVFASLFWLAFWGVRFHFGRTEGRSRLSAFLPWIFGAAYAFLARWYLGDVRDEAFSPGVDWALWYGSFSVLFALLARFLEPERGPFRGTEE